MLGSLSCNVAVNYSMEWSTLRTRLAAAHANSSGEDDEHSHANALSHGQLPLFITFLMIVTL